MSDVDYPRFEVVMGGNDAYRETLIVDAEEFIGVKSYKAKGKRLTTFDVETINELEPIRFNTLPTSLPNGDGEDEENIENVEDTDEKEVTEVELAKEVDEPEIVEKAVEVSKVAELPTKPKTPKAPKIKEPTATKEDIEKTVKPEKEKPAQSVKNDSTLPDDIVNGGRNNDDGTGQLTLF
jgi:topoisomerase-4 subunit A